MLTDPVEIGLKYRYWQNRVLVASISGYALFYFVRKNLSIAMPFMERDLHLQKSSLGLFLTLGGLLYGVSKFANGFLADRANARAFLVTGLAVSAILNLLFGLNSDCCGVGPHLDVQRMVSGHGLPPLRPLADTLVPAEATRYQNVHLEPGPEHR